MHAILSEYGQIDNMKALHPLDINEMTREEKRHALNLLTMAKEKRDEIR